MSRSTKKGPFVEPKLMKRVEATTMAAPRIVQTVGISANRKKPTAAAKTRRM